MLDWRPRASRRKGGSPQQGTTAWAAVAFEYDGWEAVIPWMSGREDLNLRPRGPKPRALPS